MGPEWRLDIGQRVANARKARGWTYRDLQQRTGVAASHLHKIEHGQVDPSIVVGYAVAEALGMTMDELCGMTPVDVERQKLEADRDRYFRTIMRARTALAEALTVEATS